MATAREKDTTEGTKITKQIRFCAFCVGFVLFVDKFHRGF